MSGFLYRLNDGDVFQLVERRCYWDAYDDMGRFFGDVADVSVVSPTSQSRWERVRSIQLLRMSLMYRGHVPVDAGTDVPSLTTIWKPGFTYVFLNGAKNTSFLLKKSCSTQIFKLIKYIAEFL